MKKTILLLSSLFVLLSVASAQRVVKVGAFNFYPGIFKDSDGEVKGFYVDALTELGKLENIRFEYVYGTWDEGLERIKSGEVDVLTSVAHTEKRATYMDYSNTALLTVWGEVYIGAESEIKGILDLEGKTIAVMKSDFNGEYLRQLTGKMSINCTYTETADFEEVFRLIASHQVDAGVANNTFGSPKSTTYGLLSSGIVFNPFDIFFTVKKGTNSELLSLLDAYLHTWLHDRNSIYNVARQKWSHGKVGTIEVFPDWLQNAIYLAVIVIGTLMAFIALLRYKVSKALEKVKNSETLFETFMENTPAFVYIKDTRLNHIYSNKMVKGLSDSEDDHMQHSARTIFEPHIAEMLEQTDRSILRDGKEQVNIQYLCELNGKKRWLHDYKFFIRMPDGKPAIGGISFDITKAKETELELIKAKEMAEESDKLKSAFLANMSHEIRTPMNGILGFAELLKTTDLDSDKQQEYLRIIEKSGLRMLNIINDIIDISRIESGQMPVTHDIFNLNKMLEDMYSFFRPEAEKKGLSFNISKGLPNKQSELVSDNDKLYAILQNLIKNAIKYTNEGSISFGYSLQEEEHLLAFFVSDTGIGIPPERQEAIFERFIQADIEDRMALQGAGLGLSIAKAYVEMLDGKIWVESEEHIGTTFYFHIPFHVKTAETELEPDETEVTPVNTTLPKLKVLVAEDDETSHQYINLTIHNLTREIIAVFNGKEAVECVKNSPDIDLVLMDIQMPEMNGIEATRKIREFNKDIVIIAQTALAQKGDREMALSAGCNDYIAKPISPKAMQSMMLKHTGPKNN
ncbi:MAG: transporter substrate-binding domain-containing protein [Bacteroidetes bacterium]|nr:transporter substrate-binding domain-containing protein [Bacteroidota bacterium]